MINEYDRTHILPSEDRIEELAKNIVHNVRKDIGTNRGKFLICQNNCWKPIYSDRDIKIVKNELNAATHHRGRIKYRLQPIPSNKKDQTPKPSGTEYIYLFADEEHGKIGHSKNVPGRINTLRTYERNDEKKILSIPAVEANGALNVRTIEKFILLYCLRRDMKDDSVKREHVRITPTLVDEIVKIVAKINLSHILFFDKYDIQIDFTKTGMKSGMQHHKFWKILNKIKRPKPNFVSEEALRKSVVEINSYYLN